MKTQPSLNWQGESVTTPEAQPRQPSRKDRLRLKSQANQRRSNARERARRRRYASDGWWRS